MDKPGNLSQILILQHNYYNLKFVIPTVFETCSELVEYTRSNLQTDKFGLHFGLDYDLR